MFELFDPDGKIAITEHHLPHWVQLGATYFITFRTADSLPASLLQTWHRERDDWLRNQNINPLSRTWNLDLQNLPAATRQAFH